MLYDLRKRFHSHLRDPFLWNAMVDDHVDEIFRIRRGSRERVGDFLLSLLTSVSLDPEEKRRIIFMSATMERWRIQQLMTIFEDERSQFDDLIRQSTIAISRGCIHHLRCHRFPMEAGPATERLGTILTRFIRLAPDHHPELHARLRRLSDPAVEDRIPAILDFIALCHQELVDELSGEKVSLARVFALGRYLARSGRYLQDIAPMVRWVLRDLVGKLETQIGDLEGRCRRNGIEMSGLVQCRILPGRPRFT